MKKLQVPAFMIVVASLLLGACTPQTVIVTSAPEVVTQVVKETVVVEGTPKVVEKEVTKVVEKEVTTVVEVTAEPEKPLIDPDKQYTVVVNGYSFMLRTQSGRLGDQIAAYDVAHPNVEVIVNIQDDWSGGSMFVADYEQGVAPDILFSGPGLIDDQPRVLEENMVMPLDDLFDVAEIEEDILPNYRWRYFRDGHLWSFPWDTETWVTHYRADLVEAAGVTPLESGFTLDDLRTFAAEMTTDDHWGFCHTWGYWNEFAIWYSGGWRDPIQSGDWSYDHPALATYFQWMKDVIDDGSMPPDMATADCGQLFEAGKVVTRFGIDHNPASAWLNGILTLEQATQISHPVYNEGDTPVSWGGGWAPFIVNKDYEPDQLAVVQDLFKFLMSDENVINYLSFRSFLTPRVSVAEKILDKCENDPVFQKHPFNAQVYPRWLALVEYNITDPRPDPERPDAMTAFWAWFEGAHQWANTIVAGGTVEEGKQAAIEHWNVNKPEGY